MYKQSGAIAEHKNGADATVAHSAVVLSHLGAIAATFS
jgi:hypothetical protein